MGRVIDHVNDRFGTDFARFEHTPDTVTEVHSKQGYHAGPSEQRATLKGETRGDFDKQLRADSELREALSNAETRYEDYVGLSTAVTGS